MIATHLSPANLVQGRLLAPVMDRAKRDRQPHPPNQKRLSIR